MSTVRCEDVRDAFLAGRWTFEPELRAHAQSCDQCAPLLADEAALGRTLATPSAETLADTALFAELDRQLADETGARAWLRSRPTGLRVALAVAGVLVVAALGIIHRRNDWASLSPPAVGLWLAAFVGTAFFAARTALPALESAAARRVVALLAAFAVPVAYAFAAALTLGPPHEPAAPFATRAFACFAYGTMLSLPLLGLFWLLDRGLGSRSRPIAAAAAGGLAANAALLLHCPATDPQHLLAGHAAIGVVLTLIAWRAAR